MLSWLRRLFGAESPLGAVHAGESPSDFTRPATWSDVVTIARLLNREGVHYVLVGGYALAAHGYVRMTEDIDIAVAPDPDNSARWIAALADLPDGASLVSTAQRIAEVRLTVRPLHWTKDRTSGRDSEKSALGE